MHRSVADGASSSTLRSAAAHAGGHRAEGGPSEGELAARAREGDREAFAQLVRRHGRRVFRAAYAMVRNQEDAKDIAQETFFRAYRGFRRFDPARPVYPWLHRIARNLSLNHLGRREGRNVGLPEEDGIPGSGPRPEDGLLSAEREGALHRAVARLSADHRAVIVLKHFQECSYAEMADILDIPLGTVMSRLYNARGALRSMLCEEE